MVIWEGPKCYLVLYNICASIESSMIGYTPAPAVYWSTQSVNNKTMMSETSATSTNTHKMKGDHIQHDVVVSTNRLYPQHSHIVPPHIPPIISFSLFRCSLVPICFDGYCYTVGASDDVFPLLQIARRKNTVTGKTL